MSDLETLLAELCQAGQQPDRALLDRVKALGPAVVPALVQMATDEELNDADQDSPEVWAPLHAIQLLGELGAAEAVEPLLPLFDRVDDDYLDQALPEAFGNIGRPALVPLRALLFDRSRSIYARTRAGNCLARIGQRHPELRAEAIAALVSRLDPAESQEPDDETLNGFVITDLLDLEAKEILPAIRRAYDEDRVDTSVVDPDDVMRKLGVPAEPRADHAAAAPEEGGMRLRLRCTACGYEREHHVERVYCDLNTMDRQQQGEQTPYGPFVIPQRITCPKCGAVDQYELSNWASLTLAAEMLKMRGLRPVGQQPARTEGEEGPLIFRRFRLADGREMHPYEARDLLRREVEAEPARPELRVRYARVLRFLGRQDEAALQYRTALQLDPGNVEAEYDLGVLARAEGRSGEARRSFERVVALAPGSRLPRQEREDFLRAAHEELAELDAEDRAMGRRAAGAPVALPAQKPVASRAVAPLPPGRTTRKVGRNEPCPCGSGKKYKKCCGR